MPYNITENVPISIPFSDCICSGNRKNHLPPKREVARYICEYMQSLLAGFAVKYLARPLRMLVVERIPCQPALRAGTD